MHGLSEQEERFVAKRSALARSWAFVGAGLLVLILTGGGWLVVTKPLLANPFLVLSRLSSDSIPAPTLTLMAGLLPVVVLGSLLLALVLVVFCFTFFMHERKYLSMIRRLVGRNDGAGAESESRG